MPLVNLAWVDNERVMFEGSPTAKDPPPESRSLWLWDRKGPPRLLLASTYGACSSDGWIEAHLRTAPGEPRRRVRLNPPHFRPVPLPPPTSQPVNPSVSEPISCTRLPLPRRLRDRRWKALRRGDGYLDFGPSQGPWRANQPVLHWDAALQQAHDTGIRFDTPILAAVDYAAHDDSYLIYDFNLSPEDKEKWRRTGKMRVWRLDRDFRGDAIDLPSGEWIDQSIFLAPTRAGIGIINNNFDLRGLPLGAGIFLLGKTGPPVRLERGLAEDVITSPDGCQIAYSYTPSLVSTLADGGPRLATIALCDPLNQNNISDKG